MTCKQNLQPSRIALQVVLGMTCGMSMLAQGQSLSAVPPVVSVNSLGMKFVRIPAGEFMMGSHETVASLQADFPQLELKRLDELSDEMPLHRVTISRAFDTSPVASYPPNAFGLHDMVGNVWEWVSDHYAENYYQTSPTVDPQGPDAGHLKVRRGGSWHTWPIYARCSYRNINAPDSRYTLLGMRLLREVAP